MASSNSSPSSSSSSSRKRKNKSHKKSRHKKLKLVVTGTEGEVRTLMEHKPRSDASTNQMAQLKPKSKAKVVSSPKVKANANVITTAATVATATARAQFAALAVATSSNKQPKHLLKEQKQKQSKANASQRKRKRQDSTASTGSNSSSGKSAASSSSSSSSSTLSAASQDPEPKDASNALQMALQAAGVNHSDSESDSDDNVSSTESEENNYQALQRKKKPVSSLASTQDRSRSKSRSRSVSPPDAATIKLGKKPSPTAGKKNTSPSPPVVKKASPPQVKKASSPSSSITKKPVAVKPKKPSPPRTQPPLSTTSTTSFGDVVSPKADKPTSFAMALEAVGIDSTSKTSKQTSPQAKSDKSRQRNDPLQPNSSSSGGARGDAQDDDEDDDDQEPEELRPPKRADHVSNDDAFAIFGDLLDAAGRAQWELVEVGRLVKLFAARWDFDPTKTYEFLLAVCPELVTVELLEGLEMDFTDQQVLALFDKGSGRFPVLLTKLYEALDNEFLGVEDVSLADFLIEKTTKLAITNGELVETLVPLVTSMSTNKQFGCFMQAFCKHWQPEKARDLVQKLLLSSALDDLDGNQQEILEFMPFLKDQLDFPTREEEEDSEVDEKGNLRDFIEDDEDVDLDEREEPETDAEEDEETCKELQAFGEVPSEASEDEEGEEGHARLIAKWKRRKPSSRFILEEAEEGDDDDEEEYEETEVKAEPAHSEVLQPGKVDQDEGASGGSSD